MCGCFGVCVCFSLSACLSVCVLWSKYVCVCICVVLCKSMYFCVVCVCVLECVSDTVDLMIESTGFFFPFVSQNTHKSVLQGI